MKLAYSTNAYRRFPIEQAIQRIARIGFDGFELMADEPHAWPATSTAAQLDHISGAAVRSGLKISNVNAFMMNAVNDFWHPSWIDPDPEDRRLRLQHTLDALRMAKKLGAPSITTEPGGPLPDGCTREQAMELFIEGLSAALLVADELEIMLLVEPEPDLLIENAEQFLDLARCTRSPMFGLNFDIGHFFCVGEPLVETIHRMIGWTRHYHVEDIAASRVHEHLVPGAGAIEFPKVIEAIEETGYDGWLTVELYPYLDDPDAAGRKALEYLTPLLPV